MSMPSRSTRPSISIDIGTTLTQGDSPSAGGRQAPLSTTRAVGGIPDTTLKLLFRGWPRRPDGLPGGWSGSEPAAGGPAKNVPRPAHAPTPPPPRCLGPPALGCLSPPDGSTFSPYSTDRRSVRGRPRHSP